MISDNMTQMLNKQFNMELYSANLYLSICSYFHSIDLDGFANFFLVQSQEERMHAMKQFNYIHQVDKKITMLAIEAPEVKFNSIIQSFETSLAHEKLVTKSIYEIISAAIDEKDFATHTFLQWFITEQVEEEASIKMLLAKLKMIGDNSSAMYLLNDELKKRTPLAPKISQV